MDNDEYRKKMDGWMTEDGWIKNKDCRKWMHGYMKTEERRWMDG